MINILFELFPALILAAFGGVLATWIHIVNRPDSFIEKWANRLNWFSFALYFFWVILITIFQNQLPFVSVGQLAAFLGFLVWAAHLYMQQKMRQGILVVLPSLVVIAMILISIILGAQPRESTEVFKGPWVACHIGFAMAGVALILGAGVYGVGYLVLQKQIQERKFGPLFSFLPSLNELNHLRSVAMTAGWIFITIGMTAGAIWMLKQIDLFKLLTGHLGIALLFWLIISIVFLASRRRWLGQRKLAGLSVVLSAVIMLLIIMSIFMTYKGGVA